MLLAAGWLLSSCQSDSPDNIASDSQIEFNPAPENVTRGALTTTLQTNGSKFVIFADKKFTGSNSHPLIKFYNGVKVEYQGKWNSETPDYWYPDNEYSFVALYPYSLISNPYVINRKYEDSAISFTYSIQRNGIEVQKTDFDDILIATHRRKIGEHKDGLLTAYEKSPVNLKFQHIMAVLDITPAVVDPLMYAGDDESKLDPDPNFNDQIIKNEYIQFRKVEFYGFQTKADISVTPSQLNSATQTYDNDVTVDVDYKLPFAKMTIEFTEQTAQHIVNNFPNCSIFEKDDAMIMLPHTLAEDSKIEMTYTVNLDTAEDPVIRHITIHPGPLKLEAGKYYKLCFTVEKVYEGQIREGSLHWIVTDLENNSDNDNWIDGGGTIRQEFDINDGKQ